MIQHHTYLSINDNSGAQEVQCIKVLGGSKRKNAYIGDIVTVAVKKIMRKKTRKHEKDKKRIQQGDVHKALVINTKKQTRRLDGRYIKFDANAAILINQNKTLTATRIKGVLSRELRNKKYIKILSIAKKIV